MGQNEYLVQNKELNKFSVGFKWGLWVLLPIVGGVILTIKILNRIFKSRVHKVLMFIGLIVVPYLHIAISFIFLWFTVKRIGCKFTIGAVTSSFLSVVVLSAVLAAMALPSYMRYKVRAMQAQAFSDIRLLEVSLAAFYADVGRYPTTEEGLKALVVNPGLENWNGPYLDSLKKDPWGNLYVYKCPGAHCEYDLYSLGADGRPGVSWFSVKWNFPG